MTSHSFDWVRQIDPKLQNLDSIPLTGFSPPFPWANFAARLGAAIDRKDLKIVPGEMTWRTAEALMEGLGDSPVATTFSLPPLKGDATWVMPSQEVELLASLLLTKDAHPLPVHDTDLSASFYRFFTLEVLHHITHTPFDKALSPILSKSTKLPIEECLCRDIFIYIQDQQICGRLLITPELRRAWAQHFSQPHQTTLSQKLSQAAPLDLSVVIGKTDLFLSDWKAVQLGDFVLLDQCTLNPDNFEGRASLQINGRTAFRGKMKAGTLKILELPVLQEDNRMDLYTSHEENDNYEDEEENESELEEEELEEDFDEDEEMTEDDELEDITALEEEDEDEEKREESPVYDRKPVAPENIPIQLTVELGKVQMTMEKFLQLEPGNLIEIPLHPEKGVLLTINGQLVGKGELIRMGEVLGVRIMDLGF